MERLFGSAAFSSRGSTFNPAKCLLPFPPPAGAVILCLLLRLPPHHHRCSIESEFVSSLSFRIMSQNGSG